MVRYVRELRQTAPALRQILWMVNGQLRQVGVRYVRFSIFRKLLEWNVIYTGPLAGVGGHDAKSQETLSRVHLRERMSQRSDPCFPLSGIANSADRPLVMP